MNLFNFGFLSAELHLTLDGDTKRKKLSVSTALGSATPAAAESLPLFRDDEAISGVLEVRVASEKRLEHCGLRIELLGLIELQHERDGFEFSSSVRELQQSGEAVEGQQRFTFSFPDVSKPHESYYGRSVRLRYLLRATLVRGSYASNLVLERDLVIQKATPPPPVTRSIKMEVGIEDCLHIEFEYHKTKYHLEDVVLGKIFFLLVRIKIKHMELAILRRESVGTGAQRHSTSETLCKFEIMDGAPVKGESVPVRLYLAPYALTPTYRNVQARFSVKYFLNLVLVDEEERRYFKQQELTLWRQTVG